jgi:hypothetical protein
MNESSICVSSPGEAYVMPPSLPPLAPSTATSAAPIPTNAKDESNRNCGSWYNVEAGDYCNLVTVRYGIFLDDFVFLNPSINENCTNLLLGISYCVAPVGDSKSGNTHEHLFSLTPTSQHILWSAWLPYARRDRLAVLQSHIHSSKHDMEVTSNPRSSRS